MNSDKAFKTKSSGSLSQSADTCGVLLQRSQWGISSTRHYVGATQFLHRNEGRGWTLSKNSAEMCPVFLIFGPVIAHHASEHLKAMMRTTAPNFTVTIKRRELKWAGCHKSGYELCLIMDLCSQKHRISVVIVWFYCGFISQSDIYWLVWTWGEFSSTSHHATSAIPWNKRTLFSPVIQPVHVFGTIFHLN